MDSANQYSQIVTAKALDELNKKVQTEIVEQGWQTEGPVINNTNGTFSQKMVK